MVLEAHRDLADRFLLPLAERLRSVSPNVLSWLAFLAAVAAGFAFYAGTPAFLALAIVFVALNALLDALDGKVAKITGTASARGDFLDHVLDRYADVIMLGGIAIGGYGDVLVGFLAVLSMLLGSYMGTQAQAVGLGRDYGGVLGRADRLVILFLGGLAQLIANPSGVRAGLTYGWTPLVWVLAAFVVLGQVTAIQRAVSAWRRLGAS